MWNFPTLKALSGITCILVNKLKNNADCCNLQQKHD